MSQSPYENLLDSLEREAENPVFEKGKSYLIALDRQIPELKLVHCIEITKTAYKLKWEFGTEHIWVGINQYNENFKFENMKIIEEIDSQKQVQ